MPSLVHCAASWDFVLLFCSAHLLCLRYFWFTFHFHFHFRIRFLLSLWLLQIDLERVIWWMTCKWWQRTRFRPTHTDSYTLSPRTMATSRTKDCSNERLWLCVLCGALVCLLYFVFANVCKCLCLPLYLKPALSLSLTLCLSLAPMWLWLSIQAGPDTLKLLVCSS